MTVSTSSEDHLHDQNDESSCDPSSSKAESTSKGDVTTDTSKDTVDGRSATVFYYKAAGLFVMIGVAVTIGVGSYFLAKKTEEDTFEDHFHNFALELGQSVHQEAFQVYAQAENFAQTVTSYTADTDKEWPLVVLPHMEARGSSFNLVAKTVLMGFSPVVDTLMREQWEEFATEQQGWIEQGVEYRGEDSETGITEIEHAIFAMAGHANDTTRVHDFPGPYLPLWQVCPAPINSNMINYNLFSNQIFRSLYTSMIDTMMPVLSETVGLSLNYLNLMTETITNTHHPHSLLLQPVYDKIDNKVVKNAANVVGVVWTLLPWDQYFQNVLPDDTDNRGIVVVTKNTCGDTFTYRINGEEAEFLGWGDLHDSEYNDLAFVTPFDGPHGLHTDGNADLDNLNVHCQYTLHIYPSNITREAFETNTPIIFGASLFAVFMVSIVIFLMYDAIVQRRQQKLEETATKTQAIVASMFPKNVRQRILEETAADEDKKNTKSKAFATGKSELKNFLADEHGPGNLKEALSAFDSKPIADLFPSATVMFADIAGFTAWSSVREPSQVFQLLETLYRAFDWIAARRKVFKVETIGDCYVAVCGLPEPRKGHAVVMARFARDCLQEANNLTARLETMLGPDTGDLTLRIGLHSGPVTAGVLRGDNCRFQLFGDTVNTAARVETNGERGRIHCSQTTADLLKADGKEHWCTERPDKIVAKGKGEMQTYWVDLKTQAAMSVSSANSSDKDAGSIQSYGVGGKDATTANQGSVATHAKLSPKLKRLVQWTSDVMLRLLKQVVARREAEVALSKKKAKITTINESQFQNNGLNVIDEVKEVVELPTFNAASVAALNEEDAKSIEISPEAAKQLQNFVCVIATLYRDVPFHNFEHASHVTMSVVKLLSRIVAPDEVLGDVEMDEANMKKKIKELHDHTYGITSDPLTQFAVVLSALIHDVDHTGVPNTALIKEGAQIAELYRNQSVAEQNSVDIAWELLMDDSFKDLRSLIYTNEEELKRFRQLVVNTVIATDICDKQLKDLRNARWEKAFQEKEAGVILDDAAIHEDLNRKATIVIEHMIQASDIAHTMQHWQIYRKWNEKFFEENMVAYRNGRSDTDPSTYWYKGELGFFDFYIIPLAKKLKECGVFGVSSEEYLQFAESNRKEWEIQGEAVVEKYLEKYPPKIEEEDDIPDDLTVDSHHTTGSNASTSKGSSTGRWAMCLDEATIHDVTETWSHLSRIDNFEETAGTLLFKNLFTRCPPAKVLFGFPISMDPSSDAMTKSKRFLQHANYMISMLDKAFALLGPDAETLGLILYDLGRKHVRLGVKESFFSFMGESLIATLKELLGDEINDDIEGSWEDVYRALSSEMIRAMNVEKAVVRSWSKLKRVKNYEEVTGVLLFQRLFVTCPECKSLFGYPADCEVDQTLLESKRFRAHAAYFVEMLDRALEMMEGNNLDDNMKRLGAMHVQYGVQPEFFPLMGEALFAALKKVLKDNWTDQMEDAWTEVYQMLSDKMMEAMRQEEEMNMDDSEEDDVEDAIAGMNLVHDKKDDSGVRLSSKFRRLVQWNSDVFVRLLKRIVARREALGESDERPGPDESRFAGDAAGEFAEVITMPTVDALTIERQQETKHVELQARVIQQVDDFVTALATNYRRAPFHNFERASHVTMSAVKLLSKLTSPEEVLAGASCNEEEVLEKLRHDTFGLNTDPTTEFALVLSALIHDMAEENSFTAAWNLLMGDNFKDLRATIYTTNEELVRFRQLVVNGVTSTNASDETLHKLFESSWEKAFKSFSIGAKAGAMNLDLKATVVMTQLMQASDIGYTMQHWHIYAKWSEKSFLEKLRAHNAGKAPEHPAKYWYKQQLSFFDSDVMPIAKKLQECGVFGTSCRDNMENAKSNCEQWKTEGKGLVAKWMAELNMDDQSVSTSSNTSGSSLGSMQLDEETMFAVGDSWEVLKRIPNYEEVAGTILFTHLFTHCKPAKVLFGFPISMDPHSDSIKTSKRFLMHAKYIIQMFDKALALLGPDVETLRVILNDLGKKHVHIGVKETFFPIMGDALMLTLRQLLGNVFDPEVEHAWREVYDAISGEMVRGMNNEKVVLASWNKLKKVEDYQVVAGTLLFRKLFERSPEAKILFGFPADSELSDEMFSSARFKSHAAYFIEMLDGALNMLQNDEIEKNMKRLGAMHVQYGVKPEYFPIMGDALFHALKSTIKKSWTSQVRAAWKVVFGNLSAQMISAMRATNSDNSSAASSRKINEDKEEQEETSGPKLPKNVRRFVQWHGDVLVRLLKQMVARREAEVSQGIMPGEAPTSEHDFMGSPFDSVCDVITIPPINTTVVINEKVVKETALSDTVVRQLHDFVTHVATKYNSDVDFHNFEHASHVTMSLNKLFSRMMSPEEIKSCASGNEEIFVKKLLHETFGITSDPMIEFTAVLSALAHDMGHTGHSNAMLVEENAPLACKYKNQSVSQQNAFDLTWELLMEDEFKELRSVIYRTDEELKRFRTVMANTIMATDLNDVRLQQLRDARWESTFNTVQVGKKGQASDLDCKASIVIELMIQASDIAHYMQHYYLYKKWSEKALKESMEAYRKGLIREDPSQFWYRQELNFFDYFVIPLAKKLHDCGVFGASGEEFIDIAKENRREWSSKGEDWVKEKVGAIKARPGGNNLDGSNHSNRSNSTNGSSSHASGSLSKASSMSAWDLNLDEDTIFHVTESWQALRRTKDYERVAGTLLFKHLFKKCPPAKVLFGFPISMDPASDAMTTSKRFLQHAGYMIQMLDKALALIGPDAETLASILSDLGKKHVRMGVKEAFFPVMGDSLMLMMKEVLGDRFNPETELAWQHVYQVLSSEMINAMNNEKVVLTSWSKLKSMKNYQEVAGTLLFKHLFTTCPETKTLFGYPEEMVVDAKLLHNNRFKAHAAYFMDMLDKALNMVEAKSLEENMKRLGQMHVEYGVQEEFFPMMGDALIYALKKTLKKDWNDQLEEAWTVVYGTLSSAMIAAMQACD